MHTRSPGLRSPLLLITVLLGGLVGSAAAGVLTATNAAGAGSDALATRERETAAALRHVCPAALPGHASSLVRGCPGPLPPAATFRAP